jgi:uncharacterized membrane protein (UPF0127 family)
MRILRRLYILGVAVVGVLQTAVYGQTPVPAFRKDAELVFVSAKGETLARIDVEIAERATERMRGLMFREQMEENQGMLFLFPTEEPLSFWMKDTPLPLDIIFLGADRTIVTIRKNTVPYSEASVPSDRSAKFVVEVHAGFADRHRLAPGDRIFWQRI